MKKVKAMFKLRLNHNRVHPLFMKPELIKINVGSPFRIPENM